MINSEKDRSINFAAVRAAVEGGLSKLESDPVRGMRSMLDLGKYFAHTRRQKTFFQQVQKMLGSKRGQYMQLIRRTVTGVDHELLKTVGINLGYFSWSQGVHTIRDIEAARGFCVPWSFVLRLDMPSAEPLGLDELRSIIEQAHALGAHGFWCVCADDAARNESLARLFGTYRDCAFVLALPCAAVTPEFAHLLLKQANCVVALYGADDAELERAAGVLHDARLLFGLCRMYDDATSDAITGGGMLDMVDRYCGQFALFIRAAGCSDECARSVHAYADGEKATPEKPAFMIDFFADIATIDRNISAQACYIEIRNGGAVAATPWSADSGVNVRTHSIADILQELAPRAVHNA